MDELDSIMNDIEQYEVQHGLQDFAAPDEAEDIELTPAEYEAIACLGDNQVLQTEGYRNMGEISS